MDMAMVLFLVIVFLVVGLVALLAMALLSPAALRERLTRTLGKREQGVSEQGGWVERAAKVARPFTRLSVPDEGWEKSALRTRFMHAGWRNRNAPPLFFGVKTMLAIGMPTLVGALAAGEHVAARVFALLLLSASALGYYLPNIVLGRVAGARGKEIFESLPDALDLLTVCLEAGLSLEQALVKVADEMHIKSVVLAQELQLLLMEMRAGFSKESALRNLALRSGVEDVDTLVTVLIQSERFGTSMGDALRVHSDNLRGKRRLVAEEAAAKIALKLLFPLIFCIFPALMIVLLGPAMISVTRVLGQGASGGH